MRLSDGSKGADTNDGQCRMDHITCYNRTADLSRGTSTLTNDQGSVTGELWSLVRDAWALVKCSFVKCIVRRVGGGRFYGRSTASNSHMGKLQQGSYHENVLEQNSGKFLLCLQQLR